MSIYFVLGILAVEVIVILFLVLRTAPGGQPTQALWGFALFAILAGILMLYRSHLEYGWMGPIGVFYFIPRQLQFITVQLHEQVRYAAFLNPLLYQGVFGIGLLAGGAGLLRVRSWARLFLMYLSALMGLLSLAHLIATGSRLTIAEVGGSLLIIVSSCAYLVFLGQPKTKKLFSGGTRTVASS